VGAGGYLGGLRNLFIKVTGKSDANGVTVFISGMERYCRQIIGLLNNPICRYEIVEADTGPIVAIDVEIGNPVGGYRGRDSAMVNDDIVPTPFFTNEPKSFRRLPGARKPSRSPKAPGTTPGLRPTNTIRSTTGPSPIGVG
jgi:hypothetical protein